MDRKLAAEQDHRTILGYPESELTWDYLTPELAVRKYAEELVDEIYFAQHDRSSSSYRGATSRGFPVAPDLDDVTQYPVDPDQLRERCDFSDDETAEAIAYLKAEMAAYRASLLFLGRRPKLLTITPHTRRAPASNRWLKAAPSLGQL